MIRAPVHPFLLALLPVLSMYSVLPGTSTPDEVAVAILLTAAVTVVVLSLAWLVYRDISKAAMMVSALALVFTVHEELDRTARSWQFAGVRPFSPHVTLPLAYLVLAVCSVVVYKRRVAFGTLTIVANLAAAGALILPAGRLIAFHVFAGLNDSPAVVDLTTAKAASATPDIWYFVLDRYGSSDTLREYGFDNEPFLRFLESRGFYVARDSRANYIKTPLSLASSLNTVYLDDLAANEGPSSNDWLPVFERLNDHWIGRFLRSQGYDYVHSGSYWWQTRKNDNATSNINYYTAAPHALVRLLRRSILEPIGRAPSPLVNVRLQQWHRVRLKMEELSRLAEHRGERPRFVFVHVLVPHGPYVFDSDGSYVPDDIEWRRPQKTNYVNQVVAVNRMIGQLIERILRASTTRPVIVLQADEGPYPEGTNASAYNWARANAAVLRHRSGILNAYHLPGGATRLLYPSISPVNSFRVIFNTYFGSELALLPDRTYRHESEERPYSFVDITHIVSADATPTAMSLPRHN